MTLVDGASAAFNDPDSRPRGKRSGVHRDCFSPPKVKLRIRHRHFPKPASLTAAARRRYRPMLPRAPRIRDAHEPSIFPRLTYRQGLAELAAAPPDKILTRPWACCRRSMAAAVHPSAEGPPRMCGRSVAAGSTRVLNSVRGSPTVRSSRASPGGEGRGSSG